MAGSQFPVEATSAAAAADVVRLGTPGGHDVEVEFVGSFTYRHGVDLRERLTSSPLTPNPQGFQSRSERLF